MPRTIQRSCCAPQSVSHGESKTLPSSPSSWTSSPECHPRKLPSVTASNRIRPTRPAPGCARFLNTLAPNSRIRAERIFRASQKNRLLPRISRQETNQNHGGKLWDFVSSPCERTRATTDVLLAHGG